MGKDDLTTWLLTVTGGKQLNFHKSERALTSYIFIFSKANERPYDMAALLTNNMTHQPLLNQSMITRIISVIIWFFIN